MSGPAKPKRPIVSSAHLGGGWKCNGAIAAANGEKATGTVFPPAENLR